MSEINPVSSLDMKNQYIVSRENNKVAEKDSFEKHMKETTKTVSLDDIFQRAAKKYDVPVKLLKAIGKAESGFDPDAVSRSGAQGVMQLMPKTAESLGVTDSFDPEQNIMGGSKYISDLLKRYDGDVNLALAAYNAGMGNVAKYGGIPPFNETQNYVVKVNKFMEENMEAGSAKTRQVVGSNPYDTWLRNQGVTFASTESTYVNETNTAGLLDEIFSYNDYLKFLDILLELSDSEDEKEQY